MLLLSMLLSCITEQINSNAISKLIKMSDKDETTWKQAVIMMILLSVLLIISEMFLFA
ncbi:hypothetical protein J32TS2_05650 [Shouchella clausii]|nr:hypothetical protein DB29_03131 [Shouchella clausii]GIN15209.1 hypothetical protein J32TS2_05650 [Shouchella clausii]